MPMTRRRLALAALLLPLPFLPALALGAEMNTLSDADKAAGWQLLFDGRSLDGWRASDAPGTFSVRDGMIVLHGPRSDRKSTRLNSSHSRASRMPSSA